MSECPYLPLSNVHSDNMDGDHQDQPMVNLWLGRTVHRSYVSRRAVCSQPAFVALILVSIFIFLFFQLVNVVPHKPVPPTFTWSSNATRNLNVYIRPGLLTALLQPSNLCSQTPFMLFVVPSAINNTKERGTIRATWGQWAKSNTLRTSSKEDQIFQKIIGVKGGLANIAELKTQLPLTSKLVFLLGKARGKTPITKTIQAESQTYGDIIVEDFVDSYTNLTLKSVFMLKWVQNNCPGVKFIMKVDDDIFVNVPNLHHFLLNQTTKAPLLTGNLICGARPIHDQWSKWYTPKYMFREGKYPNYLSGTGYVMSADLVKPLLRMALATPYFHLEDVFLTGICARKIGVNPKDNFGFSYQPRAVSPCVYKEVIMGHGVIPSEMIKLWNMLNQPKTLAKCHPIIKSKLRRHYPTKCS